MNDTVIVHFALAASVCGEIGQFEDSEKAADVVIPLIVRGEKLFVSVTLTELEKPIATDPKSLLVRLRVWARNPILQQIRSAATRKK